MSKPKAEGALDSGKPFCDVPCVARSAFESSAEMDFDVDLMRELLFNLETKQTLPRSTIVISVDAEAMDLGRHVREVEASLAALRTLAYVDGPEAEAPGFFPFRELTPKGAEFVRATRRPGDWDQLKLYFTQRRIEGGE